MILAYNKEVGMKRLGAGLRLIHGETAARVLRRLRGVERQGVGAIGRTADGGGDEWDANKTHTHGRSAIVIVLLWSKLFSVMLYSNCKLRDLKSWRGSHCTSGETERERGGEQKSGATVAV